MSGSWRLAVASFHQAARGCPTLPQPISRSIPLCRRAPPRDLGGGRPILASPGLTLQRQRRRAESSTSSGTTSARPARAGTDTACPRASCSVPGASRTRGRRDPCLFGAARALEQGVRPPRAPALPERRRATAVHHHQRVGGPGSVHEVGPLGRARRPGRAAARVLRGGRLDEVRGPRRPGAMSPHRQARPPAGATGSDIVHSRPDRSDTKDQSALDDNKVIIIGGGSRA